MKKLIVLALILALVTAAFTLTSCNNDTPDTPDVPDTSDTDDTGDTTPDTEAPEETKKQTSDTTFYGYTELTLAKDPVIDSEGRLVLYFNESILCTESTKCSIGMKAPGAAESVTATPAIGAYADMNTDSGCFGVALVPEFEFSTGTYTFSVTIGNMYIVEFQFTVK